MFVSWKFAFCFLLFAFAGLARTEDEVVIENEDDTKATLNVNPEESVPTEGQDASSLASLDADITLYFTNPVNSKDIPTNTPIRMLIGFRNKGQLPMMVDYLDASLRYPMDWSYIITNFTAIRYSHEVLPQQEATFAYGFYLGDAFHSRPFILSVNLHYHDVNGRIYHSAVHNETINVFEQEEGFDSQTFFLYVIFAAVVVLGGLFGYNYVNSRQKKRPSSTKKAAGPAVESGTSRNGDVDYDWLPESTLRQLTKSPKKSPQVSRSPQQSPKASRKND